METKVLKCEGCPVKEVLGCMFFIIIENGKLERACLAYIAKNKSEVVEVIEY